MALSRVKHSLLSPGLRVADGLTPLMSAAKNGNWQNVEELLVAGTDAQVQDQHGQTALHYAVKSDESRSAACLLAYGANPAVSDNRENQPLGLQYAGIDTLHSIKQEYRRFIKQKSNGSDPVPEYIEQWNKELGQNGILKIAGLISPEELIRLRDEFEAFTQNMDVKISAGESRFLNYDQEEHYWAEDKAYVTNNAFKNAPTLKKICSHPDLQKLANLYYGKRAFIARGTGMRYLPNDSKDHDMFQWHHDMEDKRFKMMVLLTDLGETDQCMSYAVGTHKISHPVNMFYYNKCSLEYCKKHQVNIEIYNATGKAGDIFIFDSNGAHRGNRRSDANVRDAYFIEFDPDVSNVWGGDIPAANDISKSLPDSLDPFEKMLSVRKRWDFPYTRKNVLWIENLPHVEHWL